MQDNMNYKKSLQNLKKGWKLIVSCVVLGAMIASIYSYFFITPMYKSQATLLINQEDRTNKSNDAQDLQTSLQSITTYANIAKLPDTLIPVIKKLNLNIEPEQLARSVETTTIPNSTLLTISVKSHSKEKAANIANEIANTMVMQDSLNLNNLKVASKARILPNQTPVEPTPLINIFIGSFFGLLIGLIYLISTSITDMSIKTSEEVEKELGLPVIGNIPFIK